MTYGDFDNAMRNGTNAKEWDSASSADKFVLFLLFSYYEQRRK